MSTTPETSPAYRYFTDPAERAMIAECGFRVAEYLHDEQIGSLVLVDQAARNIHIPVRDAWDIEYPDDPKPTVYFLNPDGFLAPDIHSAGAYTHTILKRYMEQKGITTTGLLGLMTIDPTFMTLTDKAGEIAQRHDTLRNRRQEITRQLAPHAAKAIDRDDQFNDRVLVLDACRHTGGSTRGITRALRDIGILDVRTGVVNNILNEGEDPDFVVFDNNEIDDDCKPFGTQKGMDRSPSLVSNITVRGLHAHARLARHELHRMKAELPELRQSFANRSQRRAELAQLPASVRATLESLPGGIVVFEASDGGLLLPNYETNHPDRS